MYYVAAFQKESVTTLDYACGTDKAGVLPTGFAREATVFFPADRIPSPTRGTGRGILPLTHAAIRPFAEFDALASRVPVCRSGE